MNFNWYDDLLGAVSKSLNMGRVPVDWTKLKVVKRMPIVAKMIVSHNLDYAEKVLARHGITCIRLQ